MDDLSKILDNDEDSSTLPNGVKAEHTLLVSQKVLGGSDVLWVFRDEPLASDSGWVLLSGTEPDGWLEDAEKFEERSVEWALEHDPSLIAVLGAPADSSFERDSAAAEWAELEEG